MDRARHVIWPNQKNLYFSVIVINNKPILSSMLAAGVVQDTFAGEAGEGEPRRLSGDEATKAFVAIEFLSQITNTLTRIRNVRTYVHGFGGIIVDNCPIHEGEARGRGQLSFDNPDVAMV